MLVAAAAAVRMDSTPAAFAVPSRMDAHPVLVAPVAPEVLLPAHRQEKPSHFSGRVPPLTVKPCDQSVCTQPLKLR